MTILVVEEKGHTEEVREYGILLKQREGQGSPLENKNGTVLGYFSLKPRFSFNFQMYSVGNYQDDFYERVYFMQNRMSEGTFSKIWEKE